MRYQVKKQYQRGSETACGQFTKIEAAREFMLKAAKADAELKVSLIYRLYDFDELLEEIDTSKLTTEAASPTESAGSAGKGQSASFRPTPLNMTPRPKGTPPNWLKDEEDKKDK